MGITKMDKITNFGAYYYFRAGNRNDCSHQANQCYVYTFYGIVLLFPPDKFQGKMEVYSRFKMEIDCSFLCRYFGYYTSNAILEV